MSFLPALQQFGSQAMMYFHMITWQLVGVLGIWHGLTYMQGELSIPFASRAAIGVALYMAAGPLVHVFNPWMLSQGVPSTLQAQNLSILMGIFGGTIGAIGITRNNPSWAILGLGSTLVSAAWPAVWRHMGGLIGGAGGGMPMP